MIQAVVKKGRVIGERVPTPLVSDGCLLIKVVNSCISAGTEMAGVNESGKSIIKRAMEQPEQVKEVLQFMKTNGIQRTLAKVKGALDGGKPTGYSISGIVIGLGAGVSGFSVGDSVAAAGAGLANHAEFVDVPVNLVMKMPQGMDFQKASTVTLGGIAMQGVRRADLRLGEVCVVVGAGILGLLAQQMLQLSGVRTIVTDLDPSRLDIAQKLGAERIVNPAQEDVISVVNSLTGGHGADAVLFTAATYSSEPLSTAFKMCKKKGRVVLVGVSGMEIKRGDIYAKELDFLISTSYGPGRYDSNYEEKGLDYPFSYVRWTENRNMTEYLRLVHEGKIDLSLLIDAVFPIEQVEDAFTALTSEGKKPIMTLLDYGKDGVDSFLTKNADEKRISINTRPTNASKIRVAIAGVGGFATGMHLPNLASLSSQFEIRAIYNRSGQKAKAIGNQYQVAYATSDYQELCNDPDLDLIMICTRHGNHAELALQALTAGKHVFVEKPLAINEEQLQGIKDFYANGTEGKPVLMTGFNRRFSKYAQEMKKATSKRSNPLLMHYRMNAGFIPYDHWTHDDGGRIIGEACHIIDLMTFFTESKVVSAHFEGLEGNERVRKTDNLSLLLKYEDGSIAHIDYFATGSKQLSKEYLEIHFDDQSLVMDDYKSLKGYGVKLKDIQSSISEKGQKEELNFLYTTLKEGGPWPIALWDMIQTTEITFEAVKE